MPAFRVKITAAYGPLMPSLTDLSGEPPERYEQIAALANGSDARPHKWFIEQHDEFSPPLLVLGTYYDLDASGEWSARAQARGRFRAELSRRGLPLPHDPIHAELAD